MKSKHGLFFGIAVLCGAAIVLANCGGGNKKAFPSPEWEKTMEAYEKAVTECAELTEKSRKNMSDKALARQADTMQKKVDDMTDTLAAKASAIPSADVERFAKRYADLMVKAADKAPDVVVAAVAQFMDKAPEAVNKAVSAVSVVVADPSAGVEKAASALSNALSEKPQE